MAHYNSDNNAYSHCRRELRLVTAYHLMLFKMAENHHYDIIFVWIS